MNNQYFVYVLQLTSPTIVKNFLLIEEMLIEGKVFYETLVGISFYSFDTYVRSGLIQLKFDLLENIFLVKCCTSFESFLDLRFSMRKCQATFTVIYSVS